jgi:hypothetical protein
MLTVLRGAGLALRLVWPWLLAPWRSPLLRWRLETYGVTDARGRPLHADEIGPSQCCAFLVRERHAILRLFRWAARL